MCVKMFVFFFCSSAIYILKSRKEVVKKKQVATSDECQRAARDLGQC